MGLRIPQKEIYRLANLLRGSDPRYDRVGPIRYAEILMDERPAQKINEIDRLAVAVFVAHIEAGRRSRELPLSSPTDGEYRTIMGEGGTINIVVGHGPDLRTIPLNGGYKTTVYDPSSL